MGTTSNGDSSLAKTREPLGHGFFGQPRALANVFGVELWERFSFYGMQGILLIYLYYSVENGGLGIDRPTAAGVVGAYGGAVYLSTILGAWLADRLFGSERVLFWSAVVIMAGHLALAVLPGIAGVIVGLLFVSVGSGGLKANATRIVGSLYDEGDSRRDAGFSIFYLGINLGGLLGPLLTGLLQSKLGFHWGFGLAAVGMAIGLFQYSLGRKRLPDQAREVPNPLPAKRYPLVAGVGLAGVILILVLVLTGVITAENLALCVIVVVILATIAYFAVILSSKLLSGEERSRIVAFIPLFVTNAAFWTLYQQQFTVVTIYSDERLDRNLFGWTFPVSWVQSINPIFIVVLSGVFAAIWTKWGAKQPSTPIKFAAGTVVMGLAFWLFIIWAGGGKNSTPLLALVGILLVFTIAELLISPVGLSASTKLAPQAYQTQMVALYFLSVSLGTAMAGELAKKYSPETEVVYFGMIGAVGVAIGVVLAALSPWVLRMMRGVR
ncbi:PTR family peptide transport protein [Leifsonia xyli subsp. cynodontis DSM 46306]|uniref:Major facilitator superfamily (MFS) profile domain-containing protein n=1 Tax=Leifsonia xyli subsp. cynodontis DSM 46306 TaxID=1389489 RepID=U3P8B3_LEIXC|nr:peptide MFS transporter [Leifsonia xyli]AGW42520.1 PTR family peptide transport protein [Leifsonia xyli subsp. cynodontis DSM 46306]